MKNDFVVVTLVDYKGSVPQNLGAKATVTSIGLTKGTVGGGKVEAAAIQYAQEILKKPDSPVCQLVTWNLSKDIGMSCGGVATFLFELSRPHAWKIVVFGAGHCAQELIPLLIKLNCHVTCVDSRAEWLDRFPISENFEKKLLSEPKEAVKDFSVDCFFIVMTQGHATDAAIVSEILSTHPQASYIGVIGSKTKATMLRAHLRQMDFSEEQVNKYYCPIGLDFGDNSPVEISYSIIAQLLQERDKLINKV